MSRCSVGWIRRSVDRSRRVGVGAGSRNENALRVPGVRAPSAHRHDIFDENFGIALAADYADAVRGGSHPKAEPWAGRGGVIVRPGPRAPQGQGMLIVPAAGGWPLAASR